MEIVSSEWKKPVLKVFYFLKKKTCIKGLFFFKDLQGLSLEIT